MIWDYNILTESNLSHNLNNNFELSGFGGSVVVDSLLIVAPFVCGVLCLVLVLLCST